MVLSMAGCSSDSEQVKVSDGSATQTSDPSGVTILKFGNVNSDTHPCNQAAIEFAETINQKTNGLYRVDVKHFFFLITVRSNVEVLLTAA